MTFMVLLAVANGWKFRFEFVVDDGFGSKGVSAIKKGAASGVS